MFADVVPGRRRLKTTQGIVNIGPECLVEAERSGLHGRELGAEAEQRTVDCDRGARRQEEDNAVARRAQLLEHVAVERAHRPDELSLCNLVAGCDEPPSEVGDVHLCAAPLGKHILMTQCDLHTSPAHAARFIFRA